MKNMIKAAALVLAPAMGMSMIFRAGDGSVEAGHRGRETSIRLLRTAMRTRTAQDQIKVTYKPQLDAFNARKAAIDTDLQTRSNAIRTALTAAGNKPTPAIEQQYADLQQRNAAAQQELQRLGQPIALAQAYVEEQIGGKLGPALEATMTKNKVDLLLNPQGTVSYKPSVDLTTQLTTEVNAVVPNVSITPPAGWQPGGQQGAAGAPAAAGAAPAPSGSRGADALIATNVGID